MWFLLTYYKVFLLFPHLEILYVTNVSWKSASRSVVSNSLLSHGLYSPWNSPGQNTGVGSLSLLQGIFPTQESNPGLPHCGWIFHQPSHQGSSRIPEWVVYPFCRWILPTQKSDQGLLHCRQILYHLSYQGNPNVSSKVVPLKDNSVHWPSHVPISISTGEAGKGLVLRPLSLILGFREDFFLIFR